VRPACKGEPARPGGRFFRPCARPSSRSSPPRKGQLDLEGHGRHTITGVAVRAYQRLLALTAVIWHNDRAGQQVT